MRGIFVEYGISLPLLILPFQFNPLQLQRNKSLQYSSPDEQKETENKDTNEKTEVRISGALKKYHRDKKDLATIQKNQIVNISEESISFELRLDATDRTGPGAVINSETGIAPQLAVLEQMIYPKASGLLEQLKPGKSFSLSVKENPPLILFIWGLHRILPVNIQSMNITETEFNTRLYPIRAKVSVDLQVIEGENPLYLYTQISKEIMALRNIANLANAVEIEIP